MKKTLTQDDKILLVSIDDWQGLYINGELFSQDHSVELVDFLSHFFRGFETRYETESDYDYAMEHGYFPQKLEELDN